jgi:heme/copper-type cytochrome/quinol oxidase subunit 3
MTSASEPLATLPVPHTGIGPLETNRGVYAVATLIITEAALFVCLFASYYFLANNKDRWSIDIPPKLTLALLMLGILIASSLVMMWGERMVKLGRYSVARFAVILTVVMGLVFLAVQTAEYRDHWKTLTPRTARFFYTITTFHAAHVVMGILMLCYLAILPNYGPRERRIKIHLCSIRIFEVWKSHSH